MHHVCNFGHDQAVTIKFYKHTIHCYLQCEGRFDSYLVSTLTIKYMNASTKKSSLPFLKTKNQAQKIIAKLLQK